MPFSITFEPLQSTGSGSLALFLQRIGDGLCPGGDGIPIPKVADWRLDALDDQLLGQAERLCVQHTVEDGDVAGPDAVGDGLLRSPIRRIVDGGAEELTFRLKSVAPQVPSNPQARRNRIAVERMLFLHNRAKVYIVKLATLGIAPA